MKLFLQKTALLLMLAALLSGAASCSKNSATEKPSNIDYWTCTMHPSVREKGPGKCPICSMDLVPVMKETTTPASSSKNAPQHDRAAMLAGKPADSSATSSPSHEFVVPVERQQQIGVTFATVEMKPLSHSIRAVGRVVPETQRVWRVVSRTPAYVQELGVNAPGEFVKKNQVLMKLYSPELLTTQRELIDLLRSRDRTPGNTHSAREDFQRLIESAERRLRLWNVTDEQITKIEQTRQAEESLPILSKVDGIVQTLPVTQGANVAMGSPLVEVADLSVVWVWGEFYQDELPMLQIGQEVTVTSSSYPGEKFRGQITLIDPFIDNVKRTGRVRLDIQNPDLKLKPDMYVDLVLDMDMGRSFVVPVSAIIPTGKRSIAFVDKATANSNRAFSNSAESMAMFT